VWEVSGVRLVGNCGGAWPVMVLKASEGIIYQPTQQQQTRSAYDQVADSASSFAQIGLIIALVGRCPGTPPSFHSLLCCSTGCVRLL
jgi:hypothetical protein